MPLATVPLDADFARYSAANPNFAEIVRQPLYDYNLLPGAGAAQLNFFQAAIGQGVTTSLGAAVGTTKTRADTNMDLAGQLPSGMQQLVESIEVQFFPGSVSTANTYTPAPLAFFAAVAAAAVPGLVNDVNTFYQGAKLEFRVLQKPYLEMAPLVNFPPKGHFGGMAAIATNSATTAEAGIAAVRAAGSPFYLEPPVALFPAMNFVVSIQWPAAVALPSGFNARVGVILDGFQKRAGQ